MNSNSSPQRIDLPASVPGATQYRQLAYLDVYDAVLNCDYAFLAYEEIDSFGHRVRIRSSQTAGAVFEPDAIRNAARAAAASGQPSFTWGYSFDPSPSDPRCIQFRVHLNGANPSEVEIHAQLRKADGTADVAKSVRFDWPW